MCFHFITHHQLAAFCWLIVSAKEAVLFPYHFGVFHAYVFQGHHSSCMDLEWKIWGTGCISWQKFLYVLDAGWMSYISNCFQSQGNFFCVRLAQCLSCKAMKQLKKENKSSVEFNSSSYLYPIPRPILRLDFDNFSLFNSLILNILKFFLSSWIGHFIHRTSIAKKAANEQLLHHYALKLSSKIFKGKSDG